MDCNNRSRPDSGGKIRNQRPNLWRKYKCPHFHAIKLSFIPIVCVGHGQAKARPETESLANALAALSLNA
jgi:hypothetical protein